MSRNSSLLFFFFLGLLSVCAGNVFEKDISPSKIRSRKQAEVDIEKSNNNNNGKNMANKVEDDGDPKPTPPPGNKTCNCTDAVKSDTEKSSNGYGGGSIFVGILFGMGLMFALSQLYIFWEKRRLGDAPAYRGY